MELTFFFSSVGNAAPEGQPFEKWIDPKQKYDIIAVGAQECHYKKRKDQGFESKESDWLGTLKQSIDPDGEYEVVRFPLHLEDKPSRLPRSPLKVRLSPAFLSRATSPLFLCFFDPQNSHVINPCSSLGECLTHNQDRNLDGQFFRPPNEPSSSSLP